MASAPQGSSTITVAGAEWTADDVRELLGALAGALDVTRPRTEAEMDRLMDRVITARSVARTAVDGPLSYPGAWWAAFLRRELAHLAEVASGETV